MEPDPILCARGASTLSAVHPRALARAARITGAWLMLSAVAWVGGCSDAGRVAGPGETESTAIISDPTPNVSLPQEGPSLSLAGGPGASSTTEVAYISLPPGAIPNGVGTTIRNPRTGSTVTAAMVGGGFDPVPLEARVGDALEFEIQLSGSAAPLRFVLVVPGARRPRVVRTDPPRGKRDVALNSTILIVFSEPIDPTTLSGTSVQLLRGTTPIAGRLHFRDVDRLTAAFLPDAPLAPRTEYQLEVRQAIRDRDGESLEAPLTVGFATGDGLEPTVVIVNPGTPGPEEARTIQEGMDLVSAGGVVRVMPGVYAESLVIYKGMTIEAATDAGSVVIAPPAGTLNAVDITTTEPVILRRLTIDQIGLEAGTYEGAGNSAVHGTGPADITIVESIILRANRGVEIENDAAVTGARARLAVRNSTMDGGERPGMEVGVFAMSDVDALIEQNTVRRTTFSCIQIQGTANAEVIGNDVDMCGRFGGIRAMMETAAQVVNIIRNTARNSAGSDSRFGIIRQGGMGVIERNSIIDYVRPAADWPIAAAIALRSDATATVRFNDISGNAYAGLRNETPSTVDATCNWWGAADGPSGAGSGSGDAVIGPATFDPFATTPIARSSETTCSGPQVPAPSGDVVYLNAFETAAGSEWSHTLRSVVPNGSYAGRGFLGEFGCTDYGAYDDYSARQSDECHASDLVALTLSDLPAHGEVTISFDFYVIRSWDGNPGPDTDGQSICGAPSDAPQDLCAPDLFNVSVAGGPTLLNATFAVHPGRPHQSYPAQYPTDGSSPANNPRHSGALEIDALGYGLDSDAVYRFTFTFAHSEPSVTFKFTAPKLQPLFDESWGLDNVEVRVGPGPP